MKLIMWRSIQGMVKNSAPPTAARRGTVLMVTSWIDVMTCKALTIMLTTIPTIRIGEQTRSASSSVRRDNEMTTSIFMVLNSVKTFHDGPDQQVPSVSHNKN